MGTGTVNQLEMPTVEWRGAHESNCGSRGGYTPEAVVLHIAEGSYEGAASWFATPASARPGGGASSAHFTVAKDGRIAQHVLTSLAAFANGQEAGATAWVLGENPGVNANLLTISIEHEGFSGDAFTAPQFEASVRLTAALFARVILPGGAAGLAVDRNHITAHRDYAPVTRSRCPGFPESEIARYIDAVRALLYEKPAAPLPVPVSTALVAARDDLTALALGLDDLAARASVQAAAARAAVERVAAWL